MCVRMCLLWEHESGLTSQLFFDWEQVVLLAQQEVALCVPVSNLCQQLVLLCSVCRFGNEVLNLQDRCWARCASVCLCVCVRECVCVCVCVRLCLVWEYKIGYGSLCVCGCLCVRMYLLWQYESFLWEYESGLMDQLFFDCEQVGLLAQQEVALSLLVSNVGQQFVLLCSVCRFGNEVLNLQNRCWERCVSVCV